MMAMSVTTFVASGLEMSTDYPGLTVKAGDELSFNLDFNNGSESAIDVDARGIQAVDVTLTPPSGVKAGEYTILISAISATESLTDELPVVIAGTSALCGRRSAQNRPVRPSGKRWAHF